LATDVTATQLGSNQAPPDKWLIALSVAFGSLMATIDSSIINVAIPHIRGAVGASIAEVTWVSTSYLIAMVLVMPLTGLLGALIGQKRLYLGSLVVFVVGSALCGMASSLSTLIVFRVIQGLGAGSLQPSQQAILRQTFPPSEQGMAMALFSMVIMIGPAIGPALGGLITDNWSWPWIFFINLPIGVIGIWMTWRNVHEPEDIRQANLKKAQSIRGNFDWLGIFLLIMGIASLQFLLEEGPSHDWFAARSMILCAMVAFFSLLIFGIHEMRVPHPVINFRLFQNPSYFSATCIGSILFALVMGNMFILPLFMQELMGFDATRSGLMLMPRSLAMMVGAPIVGMLYNKISTPILILTGILLFIGGNLELSTLALESSSWDIAFPLIINGLGMSCLLVPLTTAALSQIPRHEVGAAAGINSFFRQIGGSFGLTLSATTLTHFAASARSDLRSHLTLLRPEVAAEFSSHILPWMHKGFSATMAQEMGVQMWERRVHIQSMVLAFDGVFFLQGVAFLCAIPLLFLLRVKSKGPVKIMEISVE